MWKLSYYSGLLFDWCKPIPNQSRISILAHYLCIALSLLIVIFVMAFLFGQLLVEMWRMETFHSIMPNLIWFIWMPSAFATHIDYLWHRSRYLAFFTEWKTMELIFLPEDVGLKERKSKMFIFYYAGQCFYNFGLVGAVAFTLFGSEPRLEHPLTMSDNPQLSNVLPPSLLNAIHFMATSICIVFMLLMDVVPTLVYCNAARAVQLLRDDVYMAINEKSDDGLGHCCKNNQQGYKGYNNINERTDIQQIWHRYEYLRKLVKRADSLFGPIMILNQGITFFIICALFFTLIVNFKELSINEAILYLSALIGCLFRMISAVGLMSQLHGTEEPFRTTLLRLQGFELQLKIFLYAYHLQNFTFY